MHKANGDKAQMLTDTVKSYGGLTLSVLPGEGAWRCHPHHLGCPLPLQRLTAKPTLKAIFAFHFSIKLNILFRFL